MNKRIKITLAILAGCNKIMTIFIPMAVSLLWVFSLPLLNWRGWLIIIVGSCATLFRGLKIWLD